MSEQRYLVRLVSSHATFLQAVPRREGEVGQRFRFVARRYATQFTAADAVEAIAAENRYQAIVGNYEAVPADEGDL